jgi:transposase
MDHETSPPKIVKPRRRHSRRFKEQVLAECRLSDESVAAVALRHGLNHNLVHKWRHAVEAEQQDAGEFIRLPSPAGAEAPDEPPDATIRMDVPTPTGQITVHWPTTQLTHSVAWLKALMR